jgi:hypothetical protein
VENVLSFKLSLTCDICIWGSKFISNCAKVDAQILKVLPVLGLLNTNKNYFWNAVYVAVYICMYVPPSWAAAIRFVINMCPVNMNILDLKTEALQIGPKI